MKAAAGRRINGVGVGDPQMGFRQAGDVHDLFDFRIPVFPITYAVDAKGK